VTEKFYVNGLANDIVPIVMGAHPDDYARSSPPNSYIHVDDFESPKELAKFLKQVYNDKSRYQSYLKWKQEGRFINTFFWCRLCALLHSHRAEHESYSYPDMHGWWNPINTCSPEGWKDDILGWNAKISQLMP